MINSKMWLVVKPTVGLPIFFGGVVLSALSIHTALLINTNYYPAFLRGGQRTATSEATPQQAPSRVALLASTGVEAPADPAAKLTYVK